ncbi:MAG: hypothetical protein J6Q05_00970 [Elusimicrobiaceae bacterium]|nr:hypothetical protein [Elusimicrobiaceae bacterium]
MQLITKKELICWCGVILTVGAGALPALAEEETKPTKAVEMVTYFPVPYVSYKNIEPAKLDIGLVDDFNVTIDENIKFPNVNVRRVGSNNSATLQLNSDFKSVNPAYFGKDPDSDEKATLTFGDLYLQQYKQSASGETTDLSVTDLVVKNVEGDTSSKLWVFGKEFQNCGSGTKGLRWVNWDGEEYYYLVCCDIGPTSSIPACRQ